MSKRKFGIDIDGVLADWNRGFKHALVRATGVDLINGQGIRHTRWDWWLDYGYTEEQGQAAKRLMRSEPFWWEDLMAREPAHEVEDFLGWLQSCPDDEVYFITHRAGVNVKEQTECWLEMYGVGRPTVLICGENEAGRPLKGAIALGIGITHFLDDSGSNCRDVALTSKKTQVFMLHCEHNAGMADAAELGIRIVHSLLEFEEVVSAENRC